MRLLSYSLSVGCCRRWLSSVLVLLGLCSAQAALAQAWSWNLPTNPKQDFDASVGSGVQVQNTGTDYAPLGSDFFRVMCWDGLKPSFGWSLSPDENPGVTGQQALAGNNLGLGLALDPDVVVVGQTGKGCQLLVTYLLAYGTGLGAAGTYYEVWDYDASSNSVSLVVAPTNIGQGATSFSNVDSDQNGNAVIAFTVDFNIRAAVYLQGAQAIVQQGLIAVGSKGYERSAQPDVAMSFKGKSAIPVSFIYVAAQPASFTTPEKVFLKQVDFNDLLSGAAFLFPNSTSGQVDITPSPGVYDAPRIAAQYGAGLLGIDFFDVEAVVAETKNNIIYGFNRHGASSALAPGGPIAVQILNKPYGDLINTATCSRPAVTYSNENIEVAWTFEDGTLYGAPFPPVHNNDKEVLQISLDLSGNPNSSVGDYAIINQQEKLDQSIVSVAGRFVSTLPGGTVGNPAAQIDRTVYCFYDELTPQVSYKSLRYDNPYARQANATATPKQPLAAYPNPFHDQTTLTLTLADHERVQKLEVYDAYGQLMRNLEVPTRDASGAQQVRWDATGLKPGHYQVRVSTGTGAVYSYRVQHE